MPQLHAKSAGAGTVDGGGICKGCEKIGHIRVVGIAHVPFGIGFRKAVKIHIWKNFAHQFAASAGNQTVVVGFYIIIHQLLRAFFGGVADADAVAFIAVWSEVKPVAKLGEAFLGVFKRFLIRGGCTAKGRGDKADRAAVR